MFDDDLAIITLDLAEGVRCAIDLQLVELMQQIGWLVEEAAMIIQVRLFGCGQSPGYDSAVHFDEKRLLDQHDCAVHILQRCDE
jgi:hypothetical protein